MPRAVAGDTFLIVLWSALAHQRDGQLAVVIAPHARTTPAAASCTARRSDSTNSRRTGLPAARSCSSETVAPSSVGERGGGRASADRQPLVRRRCRFALDRRRLVVRNGLSRSRPLTSRIDCSIVWIASSIVVSLKHGAAQHDDEDAHRTGTVNPTANARVDDLAGGEERHPLERDAFGPTPSFSWSAATDNAIPASTTLRTNREPADGFRMHLSEATAIGSAAPRANDVAMTTAKNDQEAPTRHRLSPTTQRLRFRQAYRDHKFY
mgnify:CR=1 FL=1